MNFKFLSQNTIDRHHSIDFLLEYNRRLDYHYVSYHRIFNRTHRDGRATYDIFNRTMNFIRRGQLTTLTEVRRYVYLSYRSLTDIDYEINYEDTRRILDETYNFLTRVN